MKTISDILALKKICDETNNLFKGVPENLKFSKLIKQNDTSVNEENLN